ncbi:acyl-CoA dehydrogenase family protein [Jeotgalibaca porci]|uniref:acyl-CoA dehydrogenase FadE n=1 Tax=Jeotgalibaca porci TaxID=1868793 RepID=UPI0035A13E6C
MTTLTKNEKLSQLFPEDLFLQATTLTDGEIDVLMELEAAMEKHLRPVITEHSEKGLFPFEAFGKVVADVKILSDDRLFEDKTAENYVHSQYYNTYLYYVMARFDVSMATFMAVHAGLGYYTFLFGGSDEQKAKWLPKFQSFELQTCFALTEPDHGSDIAGGLATSAKRDGDKWIINGEKRWIGGAGSADLIPVFARDIEDNKIKCFVVKKGQAGLRVDKIENKIGLRMVQNGHIYLEDVEVLESDRLPHINGFRDVANILYATRAIIGVLATGNSAGAYRASLNYTSERVQFGKKLTNFQLVQEKLARIVSNLQSQIAINARVADLQTEGQYDEVRSSIAKMQNSKLMRENAALAREICGGNGILVEYDVARFFTDAEAIYTYEGTHEINSLVIGRAITGESAFV